MFELIPFREFSVANYVFTKKCARILLLPVTSLHLFHYITVKYIRSSKRSNYALRLSAAGGILCACIFTEKLG